jgi:hypothetical protein
MTEQDEKWVYFAIQAADEVIKKYGVKFFVDSLDRENIIAFCVYFRKIQDENKIRARDNKDL